METTLFISDADILRFGALFAVGLLGGGSAFLFAAKAAAFVARHALAAVAQAGAGLMRAVWRRA